MVIMTTLDFTSIAGLDFDPEVPCELRRCAAGHPTAAWVVRYDSACGCGRVRACCDPCRARIVAEQAIPERGPWICTVCRTQVQVRNTVDFTPLRKGTP